MVQISSVRASTISFGCPHNMTLRIRRRQNAEMAIKINDPQRSTNRRSRFFSGLREFSPCLQLHKFAEVSNLQTMGSVAMCPPPTDDRDGFWPSGVSVSASRFSDRRTARWLPRVHHNQRPGLTSALWSFGSLGVCDSILFSSFGVLVPRTSGSSATRPLKSTVPILSGTSGLRAFSIHNANYPSKCRISELAECGMI